uniref:Uncharacterized protein n=1 Tax=viral metagenome TaxID=1070528 RepID=A0A6C0BMA7_9ZZZZ
MSLPWERASRLEKKLNKQYSPRYVISQYYLIYRDWLYEILARRYLDIPDLCLRVNYAILHALYCQSPLMVGPHHRKLRQAIQKVCGQGYIPISQLEPYLDLVPQDVLQAFAQTVFKGPAAFEARQVYKITEAQVRQAQFTLPPPGYDVLSRKWNQPNDLYIHGVHVKLV